MNKIEFDQEVERLWGRTRSNIEAHLMRHMQSAGFDPTNVLEKIICERLEKVCIGIARTGFELGASVGAGIIDGTVNLDEILTEVGHGGDEGCGRN